MAKFGSLFKEYHLCDLKNVPLMIALTTSILDLMHDRRRCLITLMEALMFIDDHDGAPTAVRGV